MKSLIKYTNEYLRMANAELNYALLNYDEQVQNILKGAKYKFIDDDVSAEEFLEILMNLIDETDGLVVLMFTYFMMLERTGSDVEPQFVEVQELVGNDEEGMKDLLKILEKLSILTKSLDSCSPVGIRVSNFIVSFVSKQFSDN